MKMNIVDAQNACLSGGVAVGAIADLSLQPYGAIVIGSAVGILSTVGYQLVQVIFNEKKTYIFLGCSQQRANSTFPVTCDFQNPIRTHITYSQYFHIHCAAYDTGSFFSLVSNISFLYILKGFLQDTFNLHDSCGVNNLHGMPGLLSSFLSVFYCAIASKDSYGDT
jgi:ammonia channel protein AmtB